MTPHAFFEPRLPIALHVVRSVKDDGDLAVARLRGPDVNGDEGVISGTRSSLTIFNCN
jgi:hypothetical protein